MTHRFKLGRYRQQFYTQPQAPRCWLALILYALALAPPLVYGLIYLFRGRFMPYHEAALGRTWQNLDSNLQALLLGLMRVVAGGMLGCVLAGAFVLFGPFREGQAWANWAIFAVILCSSLPVVYATFSIHAKTGAPTPRLAALAVPILGAAAFLIRLLA